MPPILSSPLVRATLELRWSVLAFADVDVGAASARNLPRHGDRAHASGSGDAAPTRVWLTGFTVGAPLLHIGQIRMTYTCSGLDFAQVYPNGTEMRDV